MPDGATAKGEKGGLQGGERQELLSQGGWPGETSDEKAFEQGPERREKGTPRLSGGRGFEAKGEMNANSPKREGA